VRRALGFSLFGRMIWTGSLIGYGRKIESKVAELIGVSPLATLSAGCDDEAEDGDAD
jgi:hypothetical protein